MNKRIYIFAFLLQLISGCAQESESYFPLDKGSNWYYKGRQVSRVHDELIRRVVSVAEDRLIDGVNTSVQKTLAGNQHFFMASDSGILRVGYQEQGHDTPVIYQAKRYLFRYPLEQGTTWDDTLTTVSLRSGEPRGIVISEQVPVTARLVSKKDKVKVAAGVFKDCIRVEKQGELLLGDGKYQRLPKTLIKVKEVSWYAPGVGLVKILRDESSDYVGVGEGRLELELAKMEKK